MNLLAYLVMLAVIMAALHGQTAGNAPTYFVKNVTIITMALATVLILIHCVLQIYTSEPTPAARNPVQTVTVHISLNVYHVYPQTTFFLESATQSAHHLTPTIPKTASSYIPKSSISTSST